MKHNLHTLRIWHRQKSVRHRPTRDPEVQKLYDQRLKELDTPEKLKKHIEANCLNKIVKNEFPYLLEDDLEHFVLFYAGIKGWLMKALVYTIAFFNPFTLFVMENARHNQTVKNVKHIHIFKKVDKRKKTDD